MAFQNPRPASRRSALRTLFAAASASLLSRTHSSGQEIQRNAAGLNELRAGSMTLVTDLPVDEELKKWPDYLQQSINQWQSFFAPPHSRLQNLHPTVYLVGNKPRWEALGLLAKIPPLQDGFQNGDDLYLVEQPSIYYRRLLFLHEATHWIMYRWLGGAGSPWIMEGLADYFATHELKNGSISLGHFPKDPSEAPHWGRIRLIQESSKSGSAPKLSEIFQFKDMKTDRMARYAWSWGACTFLLNHPETAKDFRLLLQGPLDYTQKSSQELFRSLENRWEGLSIQWRSFIDDLDFGMSLDGSATQWPQKSVVTSPSEFKKQISIHANLGWQYAFGPVSAGDSVRIEATGRIKIASEAPKESSPRAENRQHWDSEPQGITIEYLKRHPLGALVGTWASVGEEQPSRNWDRFRVGRASDLPTPSTQAILLLRPNTHSAQLDQNLGAYEVKITKR